jgi:hypothetical protein
MYRKALVVTFSLLTLIVSFLITNRAFAQTDACVEGYVWGRHFLTITFASLERRMIWQRMKIATPKKTGEGTPVTNASQVLCGVWQVHRIMSV